MGLDLSLTGTGVVVLDGNAGLLESHTFGYELRAASQREQIERLISIADKIVGIVRRVQQDARASVFIEGFAFGKKMRAHQLGELHGVVKTQLALACSVMPDVVAPTSCRSKVLGKGNVKKEAVKEMLEEHGISLTDHNQRDAYVVARYGLWKVGCDGQAWR